MNTIPMLGFLEPEITGTAMKVEEVNLAGAGSPSVAPFKSSRFVVYPGEASPLDLHDVKECWFIAGGSGILTYDDQTSMPVKAGDVLFYDTRKSHTVFNNGKENLMIFAVWWQ